MTDRLEETAPVLMELGRMIGFPLRDLSLLAQALTHRSYAHERKIASNERLEFLGDAVLGLIVAEYLFNKFPEAPEGQLAKLRAQVVNAPTLAKRARILDLGSYLRLGRGEAYTGGQGRDSNLSDTFEAMVGALYIEAGLNSARTFVLRQLEEEIDEAAGGGIISDYKTLLQEELQERGKKPAYTVTSEEGPDHSKEFTVAVYVDGSTLGSGRGRSKKRAEQMAAHQALNSLVPAPIRQGYKKKDLLDDC